MAQMAEAKRKEEQEAQKAELIAKSKPAATHLKRQRGEPAAKPVTALVPRRDLPSRETIAAYAAGLPAKKIHFPHEVFVPRDPGVLPKWWETLKRDAEECPGKMPR